MALIRFGPRNRGSPPACPPALERDDGAFGKGDMSAGALARAMSLPPARWRALERHMLVAQDLAPSTVHQTVSRLGVRPRRAATRMRAHNVRPLGASA